jgi:serine/threonine protein phosphatase PrpC
VYLLALLMHHAIELAAASRSSQDRARVCTVEDGWIIVVADGAGGTGNGAIAADAIVSAVERATTIGHDWRALLAELDRDPARLGNGQSTAVILAIATTGAITGASVGDSGALLLRDGIVDDLTLGQSRKPLVGAGCVPVHIETARLAGTLLVATDGLLRYASHADIARIAASPDLAVASRALIDLVRLPSGALQDDVAVVLCR